MAERGPSMVELLGGLTKEQKEKKESSIESSIVRSEEKLSEQIQQKKKARAESFLDGYSREFPRELKNGVNKILDQIIGEMQLGFVKLWFEDNKERIIAGLGGEKRHGVGKLLEEMTDKSKIEMAARWNAFDELPHYPQYNEAINNLLTLQEELGKNKVSIEGEFAILHILQNTAGEILEAIDAAKEKGDDKIAKTKQEELSNIVRLRCGLIGEITGKEIKEQDLRQRAVEKTRAEITSVKVKKEDGSTEELEQLEYLKSKNLKETVEEVSDEIENDVLKIKDKILKFDAAKGKVKYDNEELNTALGLTIKEVKSGKIFKKKSQILVIDRQGKEVKQSNNWDDITNFIETKLGDKVKGEYQKAINKAQKEWEKLRDEQAQVLVPKKMEEIVGEYSKLEQAVDSIQKIFQQIKTRQYDGFVTSLTEEAMSSEEVQKREAEFGRSGVNLRDTFGSLIRMGSERDWGEDTAADADALLDWLDRQPGIVADLVKDKKMPDNWKDMSVDNKRNWAMGPDGKKLFSPQESTSRGLINWLCRFFGIESKRQKT